MPNPDIENEKQELLRESDELLLRYTALCHIENEAAELDKLALELSQDDITKYELNNKTLLMIKKYQKKKRNRQITKAAQKVLTKVAIFFLVLVITFSTLYITVDAFKVTVLNFVFNQEDEYTDIRLQEDDPAASQNTIVPDDWQGLYAPTYLPADFYLQDSSKSNSSSQLEYMNNNGDFIRYICTPNNTAIAIDNEDIDAQKIIITGKDGYLIEKNGKISMLWHDNDNIWQLITNLSAEEAKAVAESIKKIL